MNHDNPLIADEALLECEDEDGDDESEETVNAKNSDQVIQIDGTAADKPESSQSEAKATRPQLKRKVTRVTHTFDIEFEHLGLTLSNGTSILQVTKQVFAATIHGLTEKVV